MRHLFALALVLACAAPRSAIAVSTIGVNFNEDAYICDGVINPLEFVDLYVVAKPSGAVSGGITGAEFRIDGFDPSWITTVTRNPFSNLGIGDPIAGGCNIAFPTCQVPPNVLLYTIRVLAPMPVSPRVLTVLRHTNPSNPNFPCPRLINCSAPVFGSICVVGLTACVNGAQTCCILGTEASTWTQVKSLYGE